MEWMQQHSLAGWDGGYFLLLFVAVTLAWLAWYRWASRGAGSPGSRLAPEVPSHPDPYELAYLRRGAREVARLAIFVLVERGYVALRRGRPAGFGATLWVERRPHHPDPEPLGEIERAVFDWLAASRSMRDAFGRPLATHLEPHCSTLRQRLEREELLVPRPATKGGWRAPRRTRRGQAYLRRVQLAFGRLRQQMPANPVANQRVLLVAGLFGAEALAGTSFGYYPTMIHAAARSNGLTSAGSSGGGYSGCSSACGGGSSGGGCGGAGGGGCGGCGCGE